MRAFVLIALLAVACGDSGGSGPPTGTGSTTGSSTGSPTTSAPWDGSQWNTIRQQIHAVRCHADQLCTDLPGWASLQECLSCGPPDDWGDPPVLDNAEGCLAEMEALALADPCAATTYWPPSDTCSAYWSEIGEWPPEEAAWQSVIVALREQMDVCDPGGLGPAVCEQPLGTCFYNPSQAAACIDSLPWECAGDFVDWGANCDEAITCLNP